MSNNPQGSSKNSEITNSCNLEVRPNVSHFIWLSPLSSQNTDYFATKSEKSLTTDIKDFNDLEEEIKENFNLEKFDDLNMYNRTSKCVDQSIEQDSKYEKNKFLIKTKSSKIQKLKSGLVHFMKESRFSGIPLAMIYGLYLYYMVSYLILSSPWNAIQNNDSYQANQSDFAFRDVREKIKILKNLANFDLPTEELNRYIQAHCNPNYFQSNNAGTSEFGQKSNQFREEDKHLIGLSLGGFLTLTLGTSSIFSKNLRCSMLLVIPGLFAGRGRAIMFTFATEVLIAGPLGSIDINLKKLINTFVCLYKEARSIACLTIHTLEQTKHDLNLDKNCSSETARVKRSFGHEMDGMGNISNGTGKNVEPRKGIKNVLDDYLELTEVVDLVSGLSSSSLVGLDKPPNFMKCSEANVKKQKLDELNWLTENEVEKQKTESELSELAKKVESHSLRAIRAKLVAIIGEVFLFLASIFQGLKQAFYILIMFLMVKDGYRYMIEYKSDYSFDNKYINENIKRLWTEGDRPELTPIRKWELLENYQITTSYKLTNSEVKQIFVLLFPCILFTIVSLAIMIADATLYHFMDIIQENGKFAITYAGMDQGLDLKILFDNVDTLGKIQITKVDLTNDPCLPIPKSTGNDMIGWIIFIIIFCLVTCLLEAYTARWRSQICNLFYPDIAKRRAAYLYNKICIGRDIRKKEIQQIITIKKMKHDNYCKFTLLGKFSSSFRQKSKQFTKFVYLKLHPKFQIFFNDHFEKETILCHGCTINMVKENTFEKIFRNDIGEKINVSLCEDCLKDC